MSLYTGVEQGRVESAAAQSPGEWLTAAGTSRTSVAEQVTVDGPGGRVQPNSQVVTGGEPRVRQQLSAGQGEGGGAGQPTGPVALLVRAVNVTTQAAKRESFRIWI